MSVPNVSAWLSDVTAKAPIEKQTKRIFFRMFCNAASPCFKAAVENSTKPATRMSKAGQPALANTATPGMPSAEKAAEPITKHVLLTKDAILAKVASNDISVDEGCELWERRIACKDSLYCKVSEKGGVSVYRMGSYPVTPYREQWERLLDFSDTLQEFLKEHDSELSRKQSRKPNSPTK